MTSAAEVSSGPAARPRSTQLVRSAVLLLLGALGVWVIVCAVGLALAHPLTRTGFTHWEGGVDRWFAQHRSPGWNTVTNAASVAGDTPAAIGISVLAFIGLRLATGRWRAPILLAVSMLGEVAIFLTSTGVVGRHRPDVPHLDGSPPTSSFPSGHTAASTTLYGVLAIVVISATVNRLWRVSAVVLALVIVLSIGLSRLYRGMHYPSDIGGGILLGLLWITVTGLVILRAPGRRQPAGVR